jgi:hypothetical protein
MVCSSERAPPLVALVALVVKLEEPAEALDALEVPLMLANPPGGGGGGMPPPSPEEVTLPPPVTWASNCWISLITSLMVAPEEVALVLEDELALDVLLVAEKLAEEDSPGGGPKGGGPEGGCGMLVPLLLLLSEPLALPPLLTCESSDCSSLISWFIAPPEMA